MDEIRRAFHLFDDDNTGKISLRNLRRVAKEIGDRLEDDELSVSFHLCSRCPDLAVADWLNDATCIIPSHPITFHEPRTHGLFFVVRQAMIDEFDLDQDGEINEQEFFAIMTDDA